MNIARRGKEYPSHRDIHRYNIAGTERSGKHALCIKERPFWARV